MRRKIIYRVLQSTICLIFASSTLAFTFHRSKLFRSVDKLPIARQSLLDYTSLFFAVKSSSENSNNSDTDDGASIVADNQRRHVWTRAAARVASVALATTAISVITRQPSWAFQERSRTGGYAVQKTEDEWQSVLSPMQYFILREGGTERPYYSILEREKRNGVYKCAACQTPLFDAHDKFTSGTGWPSFARALNVETDQVNFLVANLAGAEVHCNICGGHLGDVFRDGFLFVGTEAFKTGKRYCIDGAALIFEPANQVEEIVRGDTPAETLKK